MKKRRVSQRLLTELERLMKSERKRVITPYSVAVITAAINLEGNPKFGEEMTKYDELVQKTVEAYANKPGSLGDSCREKLAKRLDELCDVHLMQIPDNIKIDQAPVTWWRNRYDTDKYSIEIRWEMKK